MQNKHKKKRQTIKQSARQQKQYQSAKRQVRKTVRKRISITGKLLSVIGIAAVISAMALFFGQSGGTDEQRLKITCASLVLMFVGSAVLGTGIMLSVKSFSRGVTAYIVNRKVPQDWQ